MKRTIEEMRRKILAGGPSLREMSDMVDHFDAVVHGYTISRIQPDADGVYRFRRYSPFEVFKHPNDTFLRYWPA